MRKLGLTIAAILALTAGLFGQPTTHISTGGTLPTTCRVGDAWYKTGTSAGLYNCSASNTWTLVSPSSVVTASGTLTSGKFIVGAGTSVITAGSLTAGVVTSSAGTLSAATTTGSGNVVLATAPTMTLSNATGLPLTTGVTGVLPGANGGAGTANGILKANGSGTVTAATSGTDYAPATSGTSPLFGSGSGGFTNGTVQGNTTKVATYAGSSPSTNDCAKFDSNGNITTAGAACGIAGGGTVTNTGTLTANAVIVGNGTTDIVALASLGSSGQVLTSNGAGSPPSFQAATGNATSSTTYASPPGSPNSGDVDFYSDSFYAGRYSGSAWVPWGPIFPMTPPVSGDFSWVNQGGASIDTANGGIYLLAPAGAGSNLRTQIKTAPSTPYTITAAFMPLFPAVNFNNCGLVWRQSSDGKLVTVQYGWSSASSTMGFFGVSKYNSPTSFSADYTSTFFHQGNNGLHWMRMSDDGTNRIVSVSQDGQHWIQIQSVGRTDFLTADQVGFYCQSNNATWPVGMTLLSWKET